MTDSWDKGYEDGCSDRKPSMHASEEYLIGFEQGSKDIAGIRRDIRRNDRKAMATQAGRARPRRG